MTINEILNIKFAGAIFYMFVFIIGSCIGSFLNVVIYRLPIMLRNTAHNDAIDLLEVTVESTKVTEKFNLSYPQSHCPRCKKNIPTWANVPIIGFFLTKMRCHYCHLPISFRYPLIETITALLFVIISMIMPNILSMTLAFIYISVFISTILISYDNNPLPKSLCITLLWIGILANTQNIFTQKLVDSVLGAILGGVIIILILLLNNIKVFRSKASESLKNKENNYLVSMYSNFLNSNIFDSAIITAVIGAWFGCNKLFEILAIVFVIYILTHKIIQAKITRSYLPFLISMAGLIAIFFV